MKSIWWIRRDLRLQDNPALQNAMQNGAVIPLFVLDGSLLKNAAPIRKAFLINGLRALDLSLKQFGNQLVIRSGEPLPVLQQVISETGAQAIYAEEDFSPYASHRDDLIAQNLPLHLSHGLTIHYPDAIQKKDGRPYTIFTPFSKTWQALPKPSTSIPFSSRFSPLEPIHSEPLPEEVLIPLFPAGEMEAQFRLQKFTSGAIWEYQEGRNRLDWEGTSTLSPYLRFGMISARTAYHAASQSIQNAIEPIARKSAEVWLNELIWREFYFNIIHNFPSVMRTAFNSLLRNIPWRNSPAELEAWQQGKTGYPVVDAAMRQLLHTGWMHNRARMITASFLTKDLLINWQEGERWFMQHLIDGDPASNNGGWQWAAGTGTDAAPWFRIFNPTLQAQKFDPDGSYVRKWVPELEKVPTGYIHEPARMSEEIQIMSNCKIGRDYPLPIVDHAFARQRTLFAYRKM